jgi:hypothetical protein
MAYWEDVFAENLSLVDENVPNFDNVIVWVFSDTTPEESIVAKWQMLYFLPKGFGISCCMPDYITENLENLQSRYISTVTGGTIDGMCATLGYREVGRDADIVVYERY